MFGFIKYCRRRERQTIFRESGSAILRGPLPASCRMVGSASNSCVGHGDDDFFVRQRHSYDRTHHPATF